MSQHVYIIDDDAAVRESLAVLLESVNLRAELFPSADGFLEHFRPDAAGCLVLDVRLRGMSGLELLERLRGSGARLPVIIITGHADVPMAVEAMKLGAIDFLEKPFREQDLLDRIQQALEQERHDREHLEDVRDVRTRVGELTRRERQVLDLLMQGKANKEMAVDLGISLRSVESHRARLMERMRARSVAELVCKVMRAEGPTPV